MKVSELHLYPVKSLKGFQVEHAELTPLGLKYDRAWMIVDESNQCITQRKHPQMILIKTAIEQECLKISAKGNEDIFIPLESTHAESSKKPSFSAVVWGDECQVSEDTTDINGVDISVWLTSVIGSKKTLRLVRMALGEKRPQSNGERFGENTTTQFADSVSYLLCNQSSLDALNLELNKKGFEPCTMEQFRPNIVLVDSQQQSLAPFSEHQTKVFENANYAFKSCDPCQRCIVPTVNIQTGVKHPKQEPYKTLVPLNPMPNNPKAPAFGQNAVLTPESNGQMIQIGDYLSVN